MTTRDLSTFPLTLQGDNVPMVSFQKVSKSYGSLTVLDSLDLDVAEGEMVTIIGPSGSGKTTVLRMLMTLETINGGVIYVDGRPLTHMPSGKGLAPANSRHLRKMRSNIGMCFQQFNLFPHMTAIENCMEGPVHVLGLSKKEARERSEELLAMVGMADKRDQHPSRLSGGQQQRVAIARAGYATEGDAFRRGDLSARPGGDRRSHQRDPQARGRAQSHNAHGHPSDGFC